jgi:cell wall-associated NlpC family hydrolase
MVSVYKKELLFYVFVCLFLAGCQPYQRFTSSNDFRTAEEEKNEKDVIIERNPEKLTASEENLSLNSQKMMNVINKQIGKPYKYGGKNEKGFDCSGFVYFVYHQSENMEIPSYSVDQYKAGKSVAQNDLRFGDLVFFNTTGRIPSHVGIYIGNNSFAHASSTSGVNIASLKSSYYNKRYVGARRIIFK